MASTHKSLRSSTANKRPTTAIADGQIALNTNSASPGLFFKDSTGATIIKIGPVHVGTTAPNATPGTGGSTGNSTGEIWLDTSLTPVGVKIWTGSAFVNATPIGSTTVQGLLELATDAETQTGSDAARAVTPAGLQSKLSDSTSTTSSTTIASSTAAKAAYDLAALALPKTGGTITGNLEIGTTGTLSFEGAAADAFETTIAVVDPTADRTITLPNVTGTIVTTGDTGTVTSTMLLDGTLLNADVNASAAIAGTKINPDFGSQNIATLGTGTAASFNPTSATVPTDGLYKPGTNQVAISTNAVERVEFGTSEVVFNDGGANYDFRIEGDTDASLFFVDASTDRVGIGTTSPGSALEINAAAATSPFIAKINTAEAARIDSSGKLLVGTSTATNNLELGQKLAVVQTGADYGGVSLTSYTGTSPGLCPLLTFKRSRGTTDGSFTEVVANDVLGYLAFYGADGAGWSQGALIAAAADGDWTTSGDTTDSPGRLVFSTTANGESIPTERMRINSNGYAKFSTNGTYSNTDAHNFYQSNTSSFGLIVGGYGAYTGCVLATVGTNSTATAFNQFEGYYGGNTSTGFGASACIVIRGDGNITNLNNSYGALSDIKLKENIVSANSQWDNIKDLHVVNFNFKEGQTHRQLGLIAQEVEQVSPGLVTESLDRDEDGNETGEVTKSVNYSVLYMKAVKALQEAMERIEILEQRLTDAGIA